jgi:hypothetical protein
MRMVEEGASGVATHSVAIAAARMTVRATQARMYLVMFFSREGVVTRDSDTGSKPESGGVVKEKL